MNRWTWPRISAVVATAVPAAYLVAGLYWGAGGRGFPFGPHDPQAFDDGDLLARATPGATGPVLVTLGTAAVLVGMAMRRDVTRSRPLLIGFGASLAGFLGLVLPGRRAIVYLPPLGLLAPLRPPSWGTLNHLVLMLAGFAWAATTLAYLRRTASRCERCGDAPGYRHDAWRVPVTWVAVAAPWLYISSRLCWALGIPLGVPRAFLDRIQAANPGHGTLIIELFLVGIAGTGSFLTWGLIRHWGVVFPRRLGGRRVPAWLPPSAAGSVAVGLTAFGLTLLPGAVRFWAGDRVVAGYEMGWAYPLPSVGILLWGVALGLAALAYRRRHRPPCRHEGGGPPQRPSPFVLRQRTNRLSGGPR